MKEIMKIIKSLEDSELLIKGVTQTIENETKLQRGGLLGMLVGKKTELLLGNMFSGKGVIRAGNGVTRTGQGF